MSAVHHSAFSNCFNIRERARISRSLAESVERQQTRVEKHQRVGLWEPRRSPEAKPSAVRDQ
jgi:hypothetical protein